MHVRFYGKAAVLKKNCIKYTEPIVDCKEAQIYGNHSSTKRYSNNKLNAIVLCH